MTTTRRSLLGATAALAAAPALSIGAAAPAAAVPAALPTPAAAAVSSDIRALWDKVIDLSIRLNAHAQELAMVDRDTGLPSWMYASGEANELGNARYDALISILKTAPTSADDLTIIARAAAHHDLCCSTTFVKEQLAAAVMNLQAA